MVQVSGKIREIEDCRPDSLPLDDLLAKGEPAVLRDLVTDWALVGAGRAALDVGDTNAAAGFLSRRR